MAFKKLKQVTLPVLKMKVGVERFFKITSPMRTGKQVSDTMAPAELVDAIDLETGELGVLIVVKVVQKEWAEQYPNNSYVGKGFSLLYTRVEGKRYNIPTIAEIELPDVIPTFDPAAKAAQEAANRDKPDAGEAAEARDASDDTPDVVSEHDKGKAASQAAKPAAKTAARKR